MSGDEEDFDSEDDAICMLCERSDDADHMLLCDDCDRGFHTSCLNPPLEVIPQGEWRCDACSSSQNSQNNPARARPAKRKRAQSKGVSWRGCGKGACDDSTTKGRHEAHGCSGEKMSEEIKKVYRHMSVTTPGTKRAQKDLQKKLQECQEQNSEKALKLQKKLDRETKKRERAGQELEDLKRELEAEKQKRREAEVSLETRVRYSRAFVQSALSIRL